MAEPSLAIIGLALLAAFFTVGWITGGTLPSGEHLEQDANTNSNFLNSTAHEYNLNVTVNFDKKIITGEVRIGFDGGKSEKFVNLDIKDLNIIKVEDSFSKTLHYEIQGEKLHVEFSQPLKEPLRPRYEIIITYSTTESNKAIQWIDAKNTESKKAPYMYFVAYPNHARSLFPCFDSPGRQLMDFTSTIRVQKGVTAYTAGESRNEDTRQSDFNIITTRNFDPINIHSLVLVVGALEEKKVNDEVYAVAEQLSEKYEAQMNRSAEFVKWVSIYYESTSHKLPISHIIMPKSFPFKVLASPNLLLVHPSMLTDEVSITYDTPAKLVDRWHGLNTPIANWDHLWITEAFSKFVAREVYADRVCKETATLDIRIGYLRMNREIKRLGDEYSSLQPNTSFKYPLDVAIPVIQGEKGYHLIQSFMNLPRKMPTRDIIIYWNQLLEKKIVVSTKDVVRHFGSIIRQEFGFFDSLRILHDFRMDLLTKETGIPKSAVNFSIPVLNEINQIVTDYINAQGASSPQNFANVKAYSKKAQLAFFEELLFRTEEVTSDLVARLGTDYSEIVDGDYDEIKSAWFQLCALKDYMRVSSKLSDFLSSTGVSDHIRPIYRALRDNGRALYAKNILELNLEFYHPFVYSLIASDLSQ